MNIIYYTYPWAMDIVGGGERQMMAYREHLTRSGIQVRLFDIWEPRFDEADIFHCFSVMPGTLELCGYAKKRGLKLVISPNLWVTPEMKQNYPLDLIWNYFELADAIIVNSTMELHALSNTFGVHESKFRIVYNGADTDFMLSEDPSAFTKFFGLDGPYVLNVANIEPRKNQLRFLEVLRRERPDLTFVVAGGIRDTAYAEECRRIGGDRLKIIGMLPYASPMLRAALSGCAFFAMPSTLETPSIAAIEAAAIGAKVLLTNQGSTTEYFGQSVTYVFPDSDASIAAGIHAVMEATNEPSLWVARDRYLWPRVVPTIIKAYESVLQQSFEK